MAFARPILERLGIASFSETVSVPTDDGNHFTVYVDRQPEYVAALALARQQTLSPVIDPEVFKAIVASSADIRVVSRALDTGVNVVGGSIASALIGTSYAEHIVR
jgi:hypothetical protein